MRRFWRTNDILVSNSPRFLFRFETLIFRAKNVTVEEGYLEGNPMKQTHFAAERAELEQNMEIGESY